MDLGLTEQSSNHSYKESFLYTVFNHFGNIFVFANYK